MCIVNMPLVALNRKQWLRCAFLIVVVLIIYLHVNLYSWFPTLDTHNCSATPCQPENYIVFLKVHKTGSTSIMNIIQRYGLARNLTFILPASLNVLSESTTLELSPNVLIPPDNKAINILCNHVIYNKTAFRTVLGGRKIVHERNQNEAGVSSNQNLIDGKSKNRRGRSKIDTERTKIEIRDYTMITMIRRPLSQVLSAAYFYNLFPNFTTDNLLETIIQTPSKYTNNRMSLDLGLPISQIYNKTRVREFIAGIDSDFHLVMLMEYFDESMVLLRRRLCWQTPDILYVKRNSGLPRPRIKVSAEQRERFQRLRAPADCALYDYFRPKFWLAVRAEGTDFFDEVDHYRSLLSLVRDYCSYFDLVPLKTRKIVPLRIATSRWHGEFSIGHGECKIMTMAGPSLTDYMRPWATRKCQGRCVWSSLEIDNEEGCARLQWEVKENDREKIDFVSILSAQNLSAEEGWHKYRFSKEQLLTS